MVNEQYEEIRQVILRKEIPDFIQREIAMENMQKKYIALVEEKEEMEQRHYIAYKEIVEEKEANEAKKLKQIQFQLLENHQLKKELDEARELIDEYQLSTCSSKQL